jgi:hypothetical protein
MKFEICTNVKQVRVIVSRRDYIMELEAQIEYKFNFTKIKGLSFYWLGENSILGQSVC